MEIDESKLFCPVGPVSLETTRSDGKTLATVMIATKSEEIR
jgi:hypothetical protein